MMRMLKAAAAAAAALAAGVAAAQETLNAVLFVPRNTTFGEIFVRFVEHVNREGKGLVQVKLIGGPDAIPTFEQGNAVKTGVVDMASVPTFYTNFCPECDAQILAPLQTPRQDTVLDRARQVHRPEGECASAQRLRRRHRLHMDQPAGRPARSRA